MAATAAAQPPGPRGGGLSGNLGSFETDRLGFLTSCLARYGPVVRFDDRTTLVLGASETRTLLSGAAGPAVIRHNFLQQALDPAQIARTAIVQKALRPSMRRAVSEPSVTGLPARLSHRLGTDVDSAGWWPDPLATLESTCLEAFSSLMFGRADAMPEAPTRRLLAAIQAVVGNAWALPASWPTPARRRINRAHRELRGLLDGAIRASPPSAQVWPLLRRGRSFGLRADEIGAALIGSSLASLRVPSAATATALWRLAAEPRAQRRIRAEAIAAAEQGGDDSPSPFVDAFAVETLRLHPPTWIMSRTAQAPVRLAGYEFPAGQQFLLSPYAAQRDPDFFDDPGVFRPDRWLPAPTPTAGVAFLPFGDGVNRCPGRSLALAVMRVVLSELTRCHTIEPAADHEVTFEARSTLMPVGLRLRLRERPDGQPSASRERPDLPAKRSQAAWRVTPSALPISAQDAPR